MHLEVLNVATDIMSTVHTSAVLEIPTPTAEQPPGGGGFLKILGWIAWVVFGFAVVGILVVSGKMMVDNKAGHGGGQHGQALATVLAGCIIASVASGIVGGVVAAAGGMA